MNTDDKITTIIQEMPTTTHQFTLPGPVGELSIQYWVSWEEDPVVAKVVIEPAYYPDLPRYPRYRLNNNQPVLYHEYDELAGDRLEHKFRYLNTKTASDIAARILMGVQSNAAQKS